MASCGNNVVNGCELCCEGIREFLIFNVLFLNTMFTRSNKYYQMYNNQVNNW